MRLAVSSYEWYDMQRWTIRKLKGSRRVEVLPYDEATAGQ